MPRGRTADQQVTVLVNKVMRLPVGHSFFVEGVASKDMEFLRRPVLKAGGGIMIWHTECDEIYQMPGVRVRREEGEFDDL
jgi:hypothetical protein